MEKVTIIGALVGLCSCGNVDGLTSEDIFGLAPNPKVWLSGQVTNARTGAPLADVAIQVAGQSTSSDGRGAFRLDSLTVAEVSGSASLHGFRPYSMALNLRPGSNTREIALEPQECGRFACAENEFCSPELTCVHAATLTGSVVSACDRSGLDARITINGKSTCSSALSGKAYAELRGLMPGGPQTLSIGKVGYQAYSTTVTLQPGFNTFNEVALEPIGGCASGNPAPVACTCTQSNCQ